MVIKLHLSLGKVAKPQMLVDWKHVLHRKNSKQHCLLHMVSSVSLVTSPSCLWEVDHRIIPFYQRRTYESICCLNIGTPSFRASRYLIMNWSLGKFDISCRKWLYSNIMFVWSPFSFNFSRVAFPPRDWTADPSLLNPLRRRRPLYEPHLEAPAGLFNVGSTDIQWVFMSLHEIKW